MPFRALDFNFDPLEYSPLSFLVPTTAFLPLFFLLPSHWRLSLDLHGKFLKFEPSSLTRCCLPEEPCFILIIFLHLFFGATPGNTQLLLLTQHLGSLQLVRDAGIDAGSASCSQVLYHWTISLWSPNNVPLLSTCFWYTHPCFWPPEWRSQSYRRLLTFPSSCSSSSMSYYHRPYYVFYQFSIFP